MLDTGYKFLEVNQSFCSMLGYQQAELKGRLLSDITHPDYIKTDLELINGLINGQYPSYKTEKKYIRKDGSTCWGSISVSPIKDHANNFSYLLGIIDDITEQKESASKVEQYQVKLQNINDCLASLGTDHDANINALTALCGTLLNATCALYNRLEDGVLCSFGQWQTPEDYVSKDKPDGHICYDVIKLNKDDSLIINNLPDTQYAKTDPNVSAYNLKTYCGQVVRCEGKPVGSLCVVYQSDYTISQDDLKILGIISSAIGNEDLRKHYTLALNKSEHILKETEAISHIGGWEYTKETDELAWTEEMYSIYGFQDKNLHVNLNLAISVFSKKDQAVIRKAFNDAVEKGIGWDMEFPMLSKDNKQKWVRTIGKPVIDHQSIVMISGNLIDITNRKSSEIEAIARNEEQRILSGISDKLIGFKSEGQVYSFICDQIHKLVSPGYVLLTSYDPETDTVRLKSIYGLGKLLETIKKSIGIDPFSYETKLADLDQNEFWAFKQHKLTRHSADCLYTVSAHNISKKTGKTIETLLGIKCAYSIGFSNEELVYGGIVILSKDDSPFVYQSLVETLVSQASVTIQRLLAEKKLQIERDNLQAILASSPVGMIILNEDQAIVQANQAAADLFKIDLGNMLNMRCGDFLGCINRDQNKAGCGHSTECPACNIMTSIEKALKTKKKIHDLESEIHQDWPEGSVSVWFRFSIEPILLDGKIHLIMALYNITEKKKAELALKKTHDYYQKIIENAPDGIVLVSMEGKFMFASSSAKKMFGYDDGDIEKLSPEDLTHPEDLPIVLGILGQLMSDPTLIPVIQYRFLAKNGEWRWIESTFSNLIHEPSVGAIVINFRDINERKMDELELKESELKYKIVANNTYDWEFWQGADKKYIYHSPSCERITGHSAGNFLADNQLMLKIIHPEDLEKFKAHQNEEHFPGVSSSIEFRIIDTENKTRFIEHVCQPVYNSEGEYLGLRGSNREITERKLVETELHNSESRFRSLIENSADAIIIIDKDAFIMYESPAYTRISGREISERIGKSGFEFIHPEDIDLVKQTIHQLKNQPDQIVHLSFRNAHSDRTWHWLDCVATNLLHDPVVQGIVVNMHDITSRKLAEDALRESESKYKGLFDANRDGISIFYVNPDNSLSQFVEVNEAAARMIGFTREEFLNFSVMDLEEGVTPEVAKEREYKIRTQGFVNTETFIKHKDGYRIDVELLVIPIEFNGRMALMNIVRDISERKAAERALRESDERWAFAIEGSNDGIWDWNIKENKVYYSNRWKEMLGFQPEEIREDMETFGQFVHPDDYKRVMDEADRYIKHEIPFYQIEHRMRCKNGEYKWILDRGKVIVYDEAGNPLRMVGTHSDISEQKKAEQALRLSEEKYRRLTDNAVDIIFRLEIDPALKMSYISPSVTAILGIEPAEFLSSAEKIVEAIHQDDRKKFLDLVAARVLPQEPIRLRWNVRKGGFKWLESRIVPIYNEQDQPIAVEGISRDITEDKLAREALNESETRFRTVFEGSPDAIFLADIETGILVDVNSAACNLIGKGARELIGMHQSQLHPSKNREYSIKVFNSKASIPNINDKLKPSENLVQCADGSQVPVEILASIINLKGRKVMHGVFRDITERKKAEIDLKESEALLKDVLNSLHAHVAVLDSEGMIISVNEPWRKFGLSNGVKTLVGTVEDVNYLEVLKRSYESGDKSLQPIIRGIRDVMSRKKEKFETEYLCNSEHENYWFSMHVTPLSYETGGVVITHENITQRKLAEDALKESEERLLTLINSAPDIICFKDEKGRWIQANDSILDLYCLKGVDYRNKTEFELADFTAEMYQDAFRNFGDSDNLAWSSKKGSRTEEVIPDIHGIQHIFDVIKKPLYYKDGRRKGLVVFGRDISDRIGSENALKESEDKFRTLAESSPYAIMIYQNDQWIYTNPAGERICEYSAEELYSMYFWTIVAPEYRDSIQKIGIKRQKTKSPDASYEFRIITKSGKTKWVFLTGSSLIYNGAPAGIISAVDITDRKIAEEDVQAERILLRTLIDNLPDTVYVKDTDARKVLANKADLRIMGFKSEIEVIGKTDLELLDPKIGKKTYEDDLKLLKSGKPIFNREEDFIDIDGKMHWLLTSKIPLFNDNGLVNGMIGIGRDITERKLGELALHESELRYRSLFNEMLEGFALHEIICDEQNVPVDYRFLNVNPAFERMTNLSAKSIVGKRVKEVLPATEDIWIKNYGNVALTGKALSFEDYSAELERHFHVVAFSPDKGKFATVIMDITDRKMVEEEVRKLNTDLEERVKIRTLELETAVQEMEAFSYSVSHDLRSPLRAISGFSRILQDDYAQLLDAEGLRVLGVIRNNTQKMDQLITDLLSLSRISRFELKCIVVNMNTLVHGTIKELIQSDEPSVIEFKIPDLHTAACDPNLIRQVWLNLISNAIKYTRSKPIRIIEIGSYREAGRIIYYVKDNGVGFNPAYTHKLFGVFQRLHKATDFEGTGVGLAIVKRIISRHNGYSWAEGAIDEGATFYFSLPE